MEAFNCFIHTLLSIPLNEDDFLDELNNVKYIALANGYNNSLVDNLLKKHKNRRLKPQLGKDAKPTFVATTHTDIMPKILTSTLSKINITPIFKTNNNVLNILRHNNSICLLYTSFSRYC